MIDPAYVVTNPELHTTQAEWCFWMAQICWTNDVTCMILNWHKDSNDFCKAWEEITDYFDKAMTTKLRRTRLSGYFTTVRFHNIMHEWKGTWVGFIAHVIEADLPVPEAM
jgi:hypothetical protein